MVAKGSRLNGRPMEKEAVLQMLREGSELHQHENKVFTSPQKKIAQKLNLKYFRIPSSKRPTFPCWTSSKYAKKHTVYLSPKTFF